VVASGGDEPVRVGERERSRGGNEHGGEREGSRGARGVSGDVQGEAASRRWPGRVGARVGHTRVLLAEEEDDREGGGGGLGQHRLQCWAAQELGWFSWAGYR